MSLLGHAETTHTGTLNHHPPRTYPCRLPGGLVPPVYEHGDQTGHGVPLQRTAHGPLLQPGDELLADVAHHVPDVARDAAHPDEESRRALKP